MEAADENCGNCRCWKAPPPLPSPPPPVLPDIRGLCRRYPAYLGKHPHEWCFEHKAKPAEKGKKAK